MLNQLWKLFTSLRLTVVCLSFGILLVFLGTLAQVDEGLWAAQDRWFRSFFIWWGPAGASWKIPVFPGGYLIGIVLLLNLIAAHIKRFEFSTKKLGINLTHAGVILLLLGQLATDMLAYESHLSFREGQTRYYSEGHREYELAFTRDAGPDREEAVVIPEEIVAETAGQADGGKITHEKLPFTVRVQKFWRNSSPSFRAPMSKNAPALATNGVAKNFDFQEAPEARSMDDKNFPTAIIELIRPQGSLGTWVVSAWSSDTKTAEALRISFRRQFGEQLATTMIAQLTEPQTVEVDGVKYAFGLRPERVYHEFGVKLLKTTHEVYPGTVTAANPQGIPKNFQSRVRIENPQKNESREVDIYMNNPLRYSGLTFFQYQMGRDEMVNAGTSTLQVVRNPSWITPYLGCIVVGVGMIVQFMYHLIHFITRRRNAAVA